MKLNFNLRKPQKKLTPSKQVETPINMIIRWNSQRLVHATGQTIHPKDWNFDKQIVRSSRIDYVEINDQLHKMVNLVNKSFSESLASYDQIPTVEQFREHLKTSIQNAKKPLDTVLKPSLVQLLNIKIESETKRLKSQGRSTGSSSVAYAYMRLLDILIDFKNATGNKIDYDHITIDWYHEFQDYLNALGYKPNYKGKLIKNLKVILNLANDKGYTSNKIHKSQQFKKTQEKTFKVYLDENEIDLLYNFDFSEIPRLDRVRDLLIIGCRTGLRISDFSRIDKDNIFYQRIDITQGSDPQTVDQPFLRVKTKKTGKEVVIPVHPSVQAILNKWKNRLPKISEQNFNNYVKDVCALAGIDSMCAYKETRGNKIVRQESPKHRLITSHTGRRSFATNLYKSRFPVPSIMAITGHSKVKDFMNYIVLDANEHAINLAKQFHNHPKDKQRHTRQRYLKIAND